MRPDETSTAFTIDGWDFTNPLTLSQVSVMCHVSAATVNRWRRKGQLVSFKTLGGHHRYSHQQVIHLLAASNPAAVVTLPNDTIVE